jgi:membrane-associated phospholipid phosphatase
MSKRNACIQIDTFPSSHVASTMACALVLLGLYRC